MPLGDKDSLRKLHAKTQESLHDTCLLCGTKNPVGFKLKFNVGREGMVSSEFFCHFRFEGYKGYLHGGVTASIIDSAMTNCLFSRGLAALTAELDVKYVAPVRCGKPATVKAWVVKSFPPLHALKAEIAQNGAVAVTAEAKFMEDACLSRGLE